MTNIQITQAFANGATYGNANSMSISGDKLYSYNTVIAQRTPDGMFVNRSRYSMTTSKQVGQLLRALTGCKVTEVRGLGFGVQSLV